LHKKRRRARDDAPDGRADAAQADTAECDELNCAGVAPSAVAAWNTIATELVKPTSIATKPAVQADKDRSLLIGRIGRG